MRRLGFSTRAISASTISLMRRSRLVCRGSHFSTFLALAGHPMSRSTSAGRKYRSCTRTRVRPVARGLHSFRFHLNFSSSVHRVSQLYS